MGVAEAPDRRTVLKIGKQADNMFDVSKNLETLVFEYGLNGSRAMEEVSKEAMNRPHQCRFIYFKSLDFGEGVLKFGMLHEMNTKGVRCTHTINKIQGSSFANE